MIDKGKVDKGIRNSVGNGIGGTVVKKKKEKPKKLGPTKRKWG